MIDKKSKIFITGHNGMLGSSVLKILKKKGYKNLITVDKKKLDLRNQFSVRRFLKLKKPDAVIIAAAKVGGIKANINFPANFINDNLQIQTNLISSSFENKVKKLILFGSSCIYPKNLNRPIEEKDFMTGSLEKTNESYAIAKIAGLKLCESLRNQKNFDAISIMPTNLYGPGDNYHPEHSHVLASLIRKFSYAKINAEKQVTCWGTGEPLREFLHVNDLSDACLFLLERWDPSSPLAPKDSKGKNLMHLNIGTGKEISIKDLAYKIASILNYRGEIIWDKTKPNGTLRKKLDISKLNALGWSNKIKFEDGLKKTIDEFNNQ